METSDLAPNATPQDVQADAADFMRRLEEYGSIRAKFLREMADFLIERPGLYYALQDIVIPHPLKALLDDSVMS